MTSRTLVVATAAAVALGSVAGCTVPVSDGGDVGVGVDASIRPAPDEATSDDGAAATPTPSPTPTTPAAAAAPDRLFVRVDDELSDDELQLLAELEGVADVAAPRRDDAALWSSRRSDGTPVDVLPEDFKVSVSVEVSRPSHPVVPGDGEVLLTTTGRRFRALDVGATVELGDTGDRIVRTVAAIVDDPELTGVELVVREQDADAIGVRPRQRASAGLAPGSDAATVTAAVQEVLGTDAIVQPRVPEDRPVVLSLPDTKARFGEFAFADLPGRDVRLGASWIRQYVVEEQLPVIGTVVCNRLIIDDLRAVFTDIQQAGLAAEVDPALYGGCWAPRRINRNANLSRHAWGIAIDVNVDFDAPGLGPVPSDGVIAAFERHGFRWGGDYPVPDNHHFEWVGTG